MTGYYFDRLNEQNCLPASGGPIRDAIPWKSNSNPNALVSFSSPSKSTRMTDVRPTQAPIVKPNTVEYTAREQKPVQKALKKVAEKEVEFTLVSFLICCYLSTLQYYTPLNILSSRNNLYPLHGQRNLIYSSIFSDVPYLDSFRAYVFVIMSP